LCWFQVHTDDHIVERLGLPTDLIRDAAGQVAFEGEETKLKAVDLGIVVRYWSKLNLQYLSKFNLLFK